MRLNHRAAPRLEAHETNPAAPYHSCRSRALILVFALALGGCRVGIVQVEEGDTDASAASQLLATDVVPSCYFGSPELGPDLPVLEYWGFLEDSLAPVRQRVDLVGGPLLTHHHDLITWVCAGLSSPPTFVLTAGDPADLEGFSWEWVEYAPEQPAPAMWPRVFYEGDLPEPWPGPFPPTPYWRKLVVELWSSELSPPLAARTTLRVDVCYHDHDPDEVLCPPL